MATTKQARRAAALTVVTAAAVTFAGAPASQAAVPADRVARPVTAQADAAKPTATQLTPASGALAGGTTVTVTGTGFSAVNKANPAAVKFGDVNASSFTVVSDSKITAVAPAGSAGAVKVTVTSTAGTSSGEVTFTYKSALGAQFDAVTGAKMAGGTTVPVTVTGGTVGDTAKDFTAEKITARVGEVAATAVAWVDATHVRVTTPKSTKATTVPITLIRDGIAGTPSTATVGYAPAIGLLAPAKVSTVGGTTVTISGTGFSEVKADDPAAVRFGDKNATSFTVKSATSIEAVAPAGVNGVTAVTVKTAGGAGSLPFAYRAPLGIEVTDGAVVKASGGSVLVKVTGGTAGATAKEFTTEAITATVGTAKVTPLWVDATHIRVPVPSSAAASAGITLIHDGVPGTVGTVPYVPVVVSLSAEGDKLTGGAKVTVKIAGGDITTATGFKFGDKAAECTAQGKASGTTWLCTVPAGARSGPTWVSFIASSGTASRFTIAAAFSYSDLD
ncbi:IPT/TIG domain-containing protein [Actinoplanes palleronii]|uniref:IPT/TIG domain-containing protein n=1 Tax=Actinoplanes palleronii TaxID=113570 RepID=A0ABQ4BSM4_9ACTN|nr:IPT/TIG domain-containing protein [Actinoplanes palleronii]GIE73256.1 hypothetical protein Apa02nite_093640 [Actinoplanes palleronii]